MSAMDEQIKFYLWTQLYISTPCATFYGNNTKTSNNSAKLQMPIAIQPMHFKACKFLLYVLYVISSV